MATDGRQVAEQSPQAPVADVAPISLAPSSASALVSRVLSLQATAGNRATTEAVARLHAAERGLARAPKPEQAPPPIIITADTFAGAAEESAKFLAEIKVAAPAHVIVANGSRVHVYDAKGAQVGDPRGFRLTRAVELTAGVFVEFGGRNLHALVRAPDGSAQVGGALAAKVDFAKDLDDEPAFEKLVGTGARFYVFPQARLETSVEPPDPKDLPEFMQFEAKNAANLPAWDAVVSPLTPQIATVNSTGSFRCDVNKGVGPTLLDKAFNQLEPTGFYWEVLKLDEHLKVTEKTQATRFKALKGRFATRERHLEEDRRTLAGDHPETQSSVEKAARRVAADQVTDTRKVLAYTGEVATTFVHALVGDTHTPNIVDYIDVPWKTPGDYFVRCLATPLNQNDPKRRRATSVAGLLVSVYEATELAASSLPTADEERADAEQKIKDAEAERAQLDDPTVAGKLTSEEFATRLRLLRLDQDYEEQLVKAAGDTEQKKVAELTHLRAKIGYLTGPEGPRDPKHKPEVAKAVEDLRKRAAEIETTLDKAKSRFASGMTPTGMMPAVLVEADTGERHELTYAVAERGYFNADELEVQIVDVSAATGRRFTGRGDGRTGAGRPAAWDAALRDMRTNLARGRGWLAYRPPALYTGLKTDVPSPMQLELGALEQVHEMVDDATKAATIVALVAAPFTGGASLGALAVIGPVQAASSAYRILDRALYDDLQLDEAAVMDLINVATLGLGKVGAIKSGGRGFQIIASGSNIAVKVFDKGQLLWMTAKTFQALTEQVPGEDERTGRRRRLTQLLDYMQAASIPVAEGLWPVGARHGAQHPDPAKATDDPAGKPGEPHTAAVKVETGGGARRRPAAESLRREVPKDLNATVEVDDHLEGTTVRVEYQQNPSTLEIFDVRIVCSKHAGPAEVRAHVNTARAMVRYSGLAGRVRILLHQLGKLAGSRAPDPGSRVWEAQLELGKLPSIIAGKIQELSTTRDEARRDELIADLHGLESQVAEHGRTVEAAVVAPGKGYVAAETPAAGKAEAEKRGWRPAEDGYYWRVRYGNLEYVAKGDNEPRQYNEKTGTFEKAEKRPPKLPFPEGLKRSEAYDLLGAYSRETDFGEYCHVLVDVIGITSHQELIALLQEPGGLKPDTVRGNLKALLGGRIQAYLHNPARLRETAAYRAVREATGSTEQAMKAASHAEMIELARRFSPEDRGSISERWYHETYAPEATPQVAAAKADFPGLSQDRRVDMMEGNTLRELKSGGEALDGKKQDQIVDFIALVGQDVTPPGGRTRKAKRLVVTFLDPLGVKANAQFMLTTLKANPGENIKFEIFNARGESIEIGRANAGRLAPENLLPWLGLPAKAAKR